MNLYINQSIVINQLRVGGITNSSIFQIGSVGMIKALAEGQNTGNFTKTAPPLKSPKQIIKQAPID